jgi:serine/threonine protein phosphatase PrpC
VELFGLTHPGNKRDKNEDRYLIRELGPQAALMVVADGMGGHQGGELAAQMVVDALSIVPPESIGTADGLSRCLVQANKAILKRGSREPDVEGMGSTATAAVIQSDSAHWATVGDSRLYHVRDKALKQITTDQTLVQYMVNEHHITAEEARSHPLRHVLHQCVGCAECNPASGRLEVLPGDILLLSSDGLHGEVSRQELTEALTMAADLKTVATALRDKALANGGRDNITLVAARI